MPTIRLPSAIFDDSLGSLITSLGEAEASPPERGISIDFQDVRFYVPSAMAVLLSTISRWNKSGRDVSYSNCDSCEAFEYFQRMDFSP